MTTELACARATRGCGEAKGGAGVARGQPWWSDSGDRDGGGGALGVEVLDGGADKGRWR